MIERDALSKMCHPGIVKLYWTFKDNRSLCKYNFDYEKCCPIMTYLQTMYWTLQRMESCIHTSDGYVVFGTDVLLL